MISTGITIANHSGTALALFMDDHNSCTFQEASHASTSICIVGFPLLAACSDAAVSELAETSSSAMTESEDEQDSLSKQKIEAYRAAAKQGDREAARKLLDAHNAQNPHVTDNDSFALYRLDQSEADALRWKELGAKNLSEEEIEAYRAAAKQGDREAARKLLDAHNAQNPHVTDNDSLALHRLDQSKAR